ncbi:purine nucleoside phosphorylase 1 [bacterium BMS3Abin04]|nr:purine nucleoside phosphorylase 1 [bacterium BMS3Abin04]
MELKYKDLVSTIQNEAPFKPELAIILGSGLGNLADHLTKVKSISTADLPGYPKSTVKGHKGFIHFVKYEGKKLLLFQGRIHFYEGYNISDCLLPVHIIHKLYCFNTIITNAAGGVNLSFKPGDLMLINSFYAFNIKKELLEVLNLPTLDQRNSFLNFPSKKLSELIKTASLEANIYLQEGSYWFGKGPSYETPAEIKMMLKFGIDAVGMSTAHEAVYAQSLGMEVGGISLITNYAAGLSSTKLSHKEVIDTANEAQNRFESLIKKAIILL